MKSIFLNSLFLIALLALNFSCSHAPTDGNISIIASSSGLMKNHLASFPIYLTDTLVNRIELEKKFASDIFIIHTGHILKSTASKVENEKKLETLSTLGFNLVNLTLEDFVIAESQGIDFEDYDQTFLNSSVVDLNRDDLASAKNIFPFKVHDSIAFIGLSDSKISGKLPKGKYIINDYVLSILKVKKSALKNTLPNTINSFVIIHTLGKEINEVMVRLPPSFINSLAD